MGKSQEVSGILPLMRERMPPVFDGRKYFVVMPSFFNFVGSYDTL